MIFVTHASTDDLKQIRLNRSQVFFQIFIQARGESIASQNGRDIVSYRDIGDSRLPRGRIMLAA